MKKLLIIVGVIFIAVAIWLVRRAAKQAQNLTPLSPVATAGQSSSMEKAAPTAPNASPALPVESLSGTYPRWEGGRSTNLNDPRWEIYKQRQKSDRAWQGKMPIEFYGKVVDENNQPVGDATAKFSWTDLSDAGSTQSETQSDLNGRFSLNGVRGKFLSVSVEKVGYYSSKSDSFGFEYALFSDTNFYQPDSSNPVVFHLRKMGTAEPLIYREQEVKIAVGSQASVVLNQQAQLQINLLVNSKPIEKTWSASVTVNGGGLQPALDEFPFEAPTEGYQNSLTLDSQTPKPPTWVNLYEGGAFYIMAGQNFGRIELEMIPGKDWLRVKSWINPNPSSRNLEFDPTQAIKP
jgi:hypothetical protein